MNYADTDETLASEVAETIVGKLRRMVDDSDDATVEDMLDVLGEMASEYELLARKYRDDERAADSKRWAQVEIYAEERAHESWYDLDHTLRAIFLHVGPEGERYGEWDRTLAEPWRSIAEVWPRLPVKTA